MTTELGVDDDLLVKTYNDAHVNINPDSMSVAIKGRLQLDDPLQHCVNAVINSVPDVEDNGSSKSEVDEPIAADETFVVGSHVRCTYDDGIDYEAKILYINDDKGTCRIKYVGYDNEQTVKRDALVASWGEEARLAQCEAATAEKITSEKSKKQKSNSRIFNPPPVPPIPPMPFDCDDDEKNQEFAQLLISWFMTGYYTGLHQRNIQSKKVKK